MRLKLWRKTTFYIRTIGEYWQTNANNFISKSLEDGRIFSDNDVNMIQSTI